MKEQVLSFKDGSLFGMVPLSREANRKSKKLFPFEKMVEKHGGAFIDLK